MPSPISRAYQQRILHEVRAKGTRHRLRDGPQLQGWQQARKRRYSDSDSGACDAWGGDKGGGGGGGIAVGGTKVALRLVGRWAGAPRPFSTTLGLVSRGRSRRSSISRPCAANVRRWRLRGRVALRILHWPVTGSDNSLFAVRRPPPSLWSGWVYWVATRFCSQSSLVWWTLIYIGCPASPTSLRRL